MNITEIAQLVTNVIQNGANVVKRLFDLHYNPTPLDVELPWIDENGQLITVKQPNNAAFRKRVWDDVGTALGQFNRTFYVDAVNGSDTNDGSSGSPFKTIFKAVNSVPSGGSGIIILMSDINMSNEPGITYFHRKKILIEVRDYKIIQDTTDKKLVSADYYGYLKIRSGNGYSGGIEVQTGTELISFVDSVGDCVIGDYDSNLTVDFTGDVYQKLIWVARGDVRIWTIRTAYNGNGVDGCSVATKDADYVEIKAHATCSFNKCRTIGYNSHIVVRNSYRTASILNVYIDAINGDDNNVGTFNSPLKTFQELVQRMPYFGSRKVNVFLLSDLTIGGSLSLLVGGHIEIKPYNNNINEAQTLTIQSQDADGDGNWIQSLSLYKTTLVVRCPLVFENPNADNEVKATCLNLSTESSFYHITGLVNDDGTVANAPLTVKDYAVALVSSNTGIMHFYKTDFNYGGDNAILYQNNGTLRINVLASTMNGGDTFDNDVFWSHMGGIRTSDNPNTLSSLVFPA